MNGPNPPNLARYAAWPWSTIALGTALVCMQASLWLGRDNMPQVIALTGQLAEQREVNRQAQERNARVVAELADFKEGEEMLQERARSELGLVKRGEVLVQYSRRAQATPSAAGATGVPRAAGAPGHAAAAATPPASTKP